MNGTATLAAAFLGGVLTSASPCVLAAVPVAVGFVGGQGGSARRA
jgi:cytochrome c biogenesis protein CcdA